MDIRSGRATVATLLGPAPLVREVRDEVDARVAATRWVDFDGSQAAMDSLSGLNRGREVVLGECDLIVVSVDTPSRLRDVRSLATDLLSTPDLRIELESATAPDDWPSLRDRIRETMCERHRWLDLTGLLPRDIEIRKAPIEDLYVDLISVTPPGAGGAQEQLFGAKVQPGTSTAPDESTKQVLTLLAGDPSVVQAPEPLTTRRPIVVLSQPGTGKTTLLRHEVNAIASGTSQLFKDARCPILVPLSSYSRRRTEKTMPLLRFVEEYAAGLIGSQVVDLSGHGNDVVLLLDGLDEVPDRILRRQILEEVVSWGDSGPAACITGRTYLGPELERFSHRIERRWLREMDDEDVEHVLQSFAVLRGRPGLGRDVLSRFRDDPDLRDLARIPLLLVFLAALAEVDRDLPSQRTLLYRDMTELLISRWAPRRAPSTTGQRARFKRGDALRVLGPLGWWVVHNGGRPAAEEELLAELIRIEGLTTRDPHEATLRARSRLGQLKEDTALLVYDGAWSFAHPSIAEYFAAVEATREPSRQRQLEANPYDPLWREVVRFTLVLLSDVFGRDRDARSLATALVEKSRRRGRYDSKIPLLILDIAQEGPDVGREAIDALLDRAGQIAFGQALTEAEAIAAREGFIRFASALKSDWGDAAKSVLARHLISGPYRLVWNDPGMAFVQAMNDRSVPWSSADGFQARGEATPLLRMLIGQWTWAVFAAAIDEQARLEKAMSSIPRAVWGELWSVFARSHLIPNARETWMNYGFSPNDLEATGPLLFRPDSAVWQTAAERFDLPPPTEVARQAVNGFMIEALEAQIADEPRNTRLDEA